MTSKLTIVLLFISITLNGQNFKFGKISKEELSEVSHPTDSGASAAVLYKKEHIRFDFQQGEGFKQIRTIHERIKIYTKEGLDWATKKVRLYSPSSGNSEKLFKLKAYTYNLVSGKIKEDKLKKDGIFEEESSKYYNTTSFTMPNVQEGSVIEFSYEISSSYLAIDDLELQYTIPINVLDVTVKTPEYFIYNRVLNPQASYTPKLTESTSTSNQSITDKSTYHTKGWGATRKTETSVSQLSINEKVITINESNVPAVKNEPFIDNLNNYRAKLILELTAIKYPNEPYKNLGNTWDDVTKTIYKSESFGEQLNKSGYFESDIDALIANAESDGQKVFLIFNHVKSKVKWNGYLGFTSDIGVRKAYKDGAGNVADMNLMLVAMLRHAGIKANPVLVSTKSNGIPLFPTISGFNYVICIVENEGITSLLDATDQYATFNLLPERDLNWKGRVIRENGSSTWLNLTPNYVSKEVTSLNVKINPDLSVEGKVRNQKSDYLAKAYRDRYAARADEAYIKSLEKDQSELLVSELEVDGEHMPLEPVKINYTYQMDDALEQIGDNIYFTPLLFLATTENPFKQDIRSLPIDLGYPKSFKHVVNIMLPEGYDVESVPENSRLDFDNGRGSFTYMINRNGKFLKLTTELEIATTFINPQNYTYFKAFFAESVEKQNEKIVLKKLQ